MTTTSPSHPFRVRAQTSGYNGVTQYIVVKLRDGRARRVSTEPLSKGQAQAQADQLNIGAMVKDYDDDPRPYAVRRAEAEAAYRSEA